jgi:hypothetical protein
MEGKVATVHKKTLKEEDIDRIQAREMRARQRYLRSLMRKKTPTCRKALTNEIRTLR